MTKSALVAGENWKFCDYWRVYTLHSLSRPLIVWYHFEHQQLYCLQWVNLNSIFVTVRFKIREKTNENYLLLFDLLKVLLQGKDLWHIAYCKDESINARVLIVVRGTLSIMIPTDIRCFKTNSTSIFNRLSSKLWLKMYTSSTRLYDSHNWKT